MKKWLTEVLTCPKCGKDLKLQRIEEDKDSIISGIFTCSCKRWYPIIGGVPRMLWGAWRPDYSQFLKKHGFKSADFMVCKESKTITTKNQVKDTFTTIWEKFPDFGINDSQKEIFYDNWMIQKLGFTSRQELYNYLKTKKSILEVGIGSAQKLKMMAEHAKGKVVGIDLTSAVDFAYKNTSSLNNVAVIQADLFALPFKKAIFDFIISDGVLHHTPDTKQAFFSIIPFLATKGELAIRVYKKSGPIREFCDDYIRSVTTKMSQEECWNFCVKMAKLGESLAKSKHKIEVPEDIELLEFKKGTYDLQRFIYYNMFKCFYNENFSFDENALVNFDWYSPVDAHRHTDDEVKQWFVEAGLSDIKIFNPESGISAKGTKK